MTFLITRTIHGRVRVTDLDSESLLREREERECAERERNERALNEHVRRWDR